MADKTAKTQTQKTQEHEKKNEGGREFGKVHEPTQAQEASGNSGLADDTGKNTQKSNKGS